MNRAIVGLGQFPIMAVIYRKVIGIQGFIYQKGYKEKADSRL